MAVAASRKPAPPQGKVVPRIGFFSAHLFVGIALALLALYKWPLRWLLSGAPFLTYSLLLGEARGGRVLSFINIWTVVVILNTTYAVAATSWLLWWIYAVACYPGLFLSCLYQFNPVAKFVRRRLRTILRELEFTNDKIAFFNLPALEIDVDVEGLMCIRGITFSFSSLTIVAHGVEVGIKFSDDMELALCTDKVTIALFRRIDVDDVYANLKGGEYEMTFGKLAPKSEDATGEPLMMENTPLLAAAAENGDTRLPAMMTMTEEMTNGAEPEDTSIQNALENVQQMFPDDDDAFKKYERILKYIHETSIISIARKEAEEAVRIKGGDAIGSLDRKTDLRAAICSTLHDKPSVPHPAKKSIKVSALKTMSPPHVRRFLHRLPLLLRLLLNPIAYFHPVFIKAITAGGSGKWMQHMLSEMVFKDYAEDSSDIRNLKKRVSSWLADANFVFEAVNITGIASVPVDPAFDIWNQLMVDDMMAHRTLPAQTNLSEILRMGGADCRITLPSFLLPHHEHLLPPPPSKQDKENQQDRIDEAESAPQAVQAKSELEKMEKDETNINVSAHVRLPACFDQELLDFIAALVKATKMVELEKADNPLDKEIHSFKDFTRDVNASFKSKMHRVAVDAVANDRWIAKLVGKVTKKLETAQGDVGYSGDMPVPLAVYRQGAETATKLMP